MSQEELLQAQAALGHTFRDPSLLERALRHSSVVDVRHESNERLEFLGDAVLGLAACEAIYRTYPRLMEGEMTKIKSLVVSRRSCSDMAGRLGLSRFINLGKGMQNGADIPTSLPAAAFEAVIAAIYLHAGLHAVARFLQPLLGPVIDRAANSGHQENYKSVLQQHAQQALQGIPIYRILDEKGPDHAKCFKVCVELSGRRFDASWAQSKKQAEQMAALSALRELGVIERGEDGADRLNEPAAQDA